MKCFMKEPRLRQPADELLTHPWICQIPRNKVEQVTLALCKDILITWLFTIHELEHSISSRKRDINR